jgi:hypothetical protein
MELVSLILAAVAGAAHPDLPDAPAVASDSLLTEWAERLDRAASFRVIHQEVRLRPAPFRSAVPCHYKVRIQHADDGVKADSALAALLGSAIRHAASSPSLKGACVDSIYGDEIELRLDRGEDMVVASYSPGKGSLTFRDAQHHVIVDYPGAGGIELLAILANRLPDDLRLEEIRPCTASRLASRRLASRNRNSTSRCPRRPKRFRRTTIPMRLGIAARKGP